MPFWNGTRRTLPEIYIFKASKNNHVNEKEMVLQQSHQNTRWARIVVKDCLWNQYQAIFSYMTKCSLSTFVIKIHTAIKNSPLWHFSHYKLFWNSWSFNSTASLYGWNNWVTLASILDYSPKLFFPKSPDSYLTQDFKSELDKLDVLLNRIHITKDTPNMSDLELQAIFNF